MTRDYPLYIWRSNNSNGMGGLNVLDNIVVFYIFFTIVGFLAAMIGTIIGAGGGLVFVPLFMYWFPELVSVHGRRDIAFFQLCAMLFLDR